MLHKKSGAFLFEVNSIVDGKMAILNITDTAGQEEFSFLADAWIRESGMATIHFIHSIILHREKELFWFCTFLLFECFILLLF